jgi:hypothetical protein
LTEIDQKRLPRQQQARLQGYDVTERVLPAEFAVVSLHRRSYGWVYL